MRAPFRSARGGRQRGAALIVSLVLLMVLTMLAISTLRTASLDLVMAGNAQYRQNAFHLAQSGLDAIVRGPEPAGAPPCGTEPDDAPVPIPALGGQCVPRVCYRGESILNEGTSTGPSFHYEIAADGITEQRGARVSLVQGLAYQGARGQGGG